MIYKIGDVAYAYVQFLDGGDNRKRIVVILGEEEAAEVEEYENNLTYEAFNITSQEHKNIKANIPLFKDNVNNLNSDSYVKMDRIYEIDNRCIIKKFGALSEDDRQRLLIEKEYFRAKGKQERQPLEKNLESLKYHRRLEYLSHSSERE